MLWMWQGADENMQIVVRDSMPSFLLLYRSSQRLQMLGNCNFQLAEAVLAA